MKSENMVEQEELLKNKSDEEVKTQKKKVKRKKKEVVNEELTSNSTTVEEKDSKKQEIKLKDYELLEDNNIFKYTIDKYPDEVEGICFIGDPHLLSLRPGRRIDDYTNTILNKLREVRDYCNNNNLLAVILGDLYDNANDKDVEMNTELALILKSFKFKAISAVGNHDINEIRLLNNNPLKMLERLDFLYLLESNGLGFEIVIKKGRSKKKILLGSTPYGMPIVDNISKLLGINEEQIINGITLEQKQEVEEQEKKNKVSGNLPIYLQQNFNSTQYKNIEKYKTDNNIEEILWLTHHDLAMNGAYPNSIPLKEILGVDRVINGHIHGTKESVIIKNTVYYNKGNIARNKIDLINHRPAVWVYSPFDSEEEPSINGIKCKALIPYYLNVQEGKDVFRLTGKHAGKNSLTEEDIKDLIEPKEKVFASLLHQQEDEVNKTEDATVVEESLAEFLETEKPRKEVCDLIFNLLKRTQEKTIE